MASPTPDPALRELPRVYLLEGLELPLRVEPLALVTPLAGELDVRGVGEALRLSGGELLVVRRGDIEIQWRQAPRRLALFAASPAWVAAFYALLGREPATPARALDRLPAGSPLARRALQLLGRSSRDVDARPSPPLVAELLEIAFRAEGVPLSPDSMRSQAERRAALVRALADYDPEADGEFSLQGLAGRLGLSTRQTARLVRGESGHSFRQLKAVARLERARKLLASSDLSILEVALRAGWNSASQFHEAFRSHVGVTPARYRAAHRG
jgi:AraC-like DNA-binding protein